MLRNYIKIAWRSLVNNKLYSFINITGLSAGITCCVLIALFIKSELSYDRFQEKGERISRVIMEYSFGDASNKGNYTSTKVGPSFKKNFPEVEEFVRMTKSDRIVQYKEKLFVEKRFVYADSTFFRLFSFPAVDGNPELALNGPNKILLSQSMAKKYFGEENPLGKTIKISSEKIDYLITGVLKDCPENSQIKFDFVASFSSLGAAQEETYWNANYFTYLLHKNTTDRNKLQAKIPAFMKKEMKAELEGTDYLTYYLEPFFDVHLRSEYAGFEPNRSISYIYILAAVALLILIIACFTFINLCTAKSVERAREIGIRKVTGALKSQIFWQFIGESAVMTLLSSLLAGVFVVALLPYFNQLVGSNLSANEITSPFVILFFVLIIVLVSFLAGAYPALFLAALRPVSVLKGFFKNTGSGVFLRKSLFVFQFVISVFLIVCTLIVRNQLDYFQNKKLGYDKEQVMILPFDGKVYAKYDVFRKALEGVSTVKNVARADFLPSNIVGGYSMYKPEMSATRSYAVNAGTIDERYIATCGIEMIAGTPLTEKDVQDAYNEEDYKKSYYHFVLNESAVKQMGWTVKDAIGKKMFLGESRPGEVKAVVRDFHFSSLHNPIKPLVMFPGSYGSIMLVKLSSADMKQSIAAVQAEWKKNFSHRPFEYKFLDENYKAMYDSESKLSEAMTVFSFIAITLALLGLFGLAGYNIHQRTKEIGVLKVFGAPVLNIVMRLSTNFLGLISLSMIIAFPAAWFAMNKWLSDFSYRIDITPWYFVMAGCGALLIAFATIGIRAFRAAMANPIKSLRTE